MYLVTGGAGFIGSHIVERLVSMGKSVRVFDNFSFGSKENLNGIGERVEILSGDLLDLDAVQRAMKGVQVVFHQAPDRHIPESDASLRWRASACRQDQTECGELEWHSSALVYPLYRFE